MEATYTNKGKNLLPLFIIGIMGLFLYFLILGQNVSQFRIIEVVSGHAWNSHGAEVNDAIRCLNDKGSSISFKTQGFTDKSGNQIPTNMWLCFDGKDWYAVVTTHFYRLGGNKIARLVTAYKIAKDIFPQINDFVTYAATKWNAIQISYGIEPGNIILQPK